MWKYIENSTSRLRKKFLRKKQKKRCVVSYFDIVFLFSVSSFTEHSTSTASYTTKSFSKKKKMDDDEQDLDAKNLDWLDSDKIEDDSDEIEEQLCDRCGRVADRKKDSCTICNRTEFFSVICDDCRFCDETVLDSCDQCNETFCCYLGCGEETNRRSKHCHDGTRYKVCDECGNILKTQPIEFLNE